MHAAQEASISATPAETMFLILQLQSGSGYTMMSLVTVSLVNPLTAGPEQPHSPHLVLLGERVPTVVIVIVPAGSGITGQANLSGVLMPSYFPPGQ